MAGSTLIITFADLSLGVANVANRPICAQHPFPSDKYFKQGNHKMPNLFANIYDVIEVEKLSEGVDQDDIYGAVIEENLQQADEATLLSGDITVNRYPNSRFWMISANETLLAVVVYKRGAEEIRRCLNVLKNELRICQQTSGPTQPLAESVRRRQSRHKKKKGGKRPKIRPKKYMPSKPVSAWWQSRRGVLRSANRLLNPLSNRSVFNAPSPFAKDSPFSPTATAMVAAVPEG